MQIELGNLIPISTFLCFAFRISEHV